MLAVNYCCGLKRTRLSHLFDVTHTTKPPPSSMERNAKALVDKLHEPEPADVLDGLTALSHSLWTRNAVLTQLFCELGGLARLLDLLRPRALDHLSHDLAHIEIQLHQAAGGEPCVVVGSWPSVLRGMAAEGGLRVRVAGTCWPLTCETSTNRRRLTDTTICSTRHRCYPCHRFHVNNNEQPSAGSVKVCRKWCSRWYAMDTHGSRACLNRCSPPARTWNVTEA